MISKEVGAALVSGGAGFLGSLVNAHSMNKYNKTQKEIAQLNNEYNYRMFNEQNQWNLEQWQRENEYNTPEAQRQRFEDAGINPYMAMGNMTAGNAQGNITSAVPQPAEMPNLRPNMALGEGVQQSFAQGIAAYSAAANVEKTISEARLNDIDSQTRLAENIARLKKSGAETAALELENTLNQRIFDFRVKLADESVKDITNHAALMFEQAQQQRLQNDITRIYGTSLAARQVDLLQAETQKYISEVKTNNEMLPYKKAESVARRVLDYAHAHKMNMESWQIGELTSSLAEYYSASAFEYRQRGEATNYDTIMRKVYSDKDPYSISPLDVEFQRYINQGKLIDQKAVYDVIGSLIGVGVGKSVKGSPARSVGGFNSSSSRRFNWRDYVHIHW